LPERVATPCDSVSRVVIISSDQERAGAARRLDPTPSTIAGLVVIVGSTSTSTCDAGRAISSPAGTEMARHLTAPLGSRTIHHKSSTSLHPSLEADVEAIHAGLSSGCEPAGWVSA